MSNDLIKSIESFLEPQKSTPRPYVTPVVEFAHLQSALAEDTTKYERLVETLEINSSPWYTPNALYRGFMKAIGLKGWFDVERLYKEQRASLMRIQEYLKSIVERMKTVLPGVRENKKESLRKLQVAEEIAPQLDDLLEETATRSELVGESTSPSLLLRMEESGEEAQKMRVLKLRFLNKRGYHQCAFEEYKNAELVLQHIEIAATLMIDHAGDALKLMEGTQAAYDIAQKWNEIGRQLGSSASHIAESRKLMQEEYRKAMEQSQQVLEFFNQK